MSDFSDVEWDINDMPVNKAEVIIPGDKIAKHIQKKMAGMIDDFKKRFNLSSPKLVILQVGDLEDANTYIRNKVKACELCGISYEVRHIVTSKLREDGSVYNFGEFKIFEIIRDTIIELNNDESVNGIILQLPIPWHTFGTTPYMMKRHYTDDMRNRDNFRWIELTTELLGTIAREKDVDGLSETMAARLGLDSQRHLKPMEELKGMDDIEDIDKITDYFVPATPFGIWYLLHKLYNIKTEGKNVVVIGRSDIVGKPMARIMSNKSMGNANVTLLHSKTPEYVLYDQLQKADIVISAVGKEDGYLLTKDNIRAGTIVIDAGIVVEHAEDGKRRIRGDADWKNLKDICKYITPVPKGVGPLTVTMLLYNTIKAWLWQNNLLKRNIDIIIENNGKDVTDKVGIDTDSPPG